MHADADRRRRQTVFLSHSTSADGALCAQLASELGRHGIGAWFSSGASAIDPGEDWHERMLEEVLKSDVLVVLASEHMFASKWCRSEVRHAFEHDKPILLVRVDDRPLPVWLNSMAGERQHLSLLRTPLHGVAEQLSGVVQQVVKGPRDITQLVELDFDESARGVSWPVQVAHDGRKVVMHVPIPPSGRGQVVEHPLPGGGVLSVHVRIRSSATFELMPDGVSVLTWVEVDPASLLEREHILVRTLDGSRQVELPPRLRHVGARVRLRGAGIGNRGRSSGDLVVEIRASAAAGQRAASPDGFSETYRQLAVPAVVSAWLAPLLGMIGSSGVFRFGLAWGLFTCVAYSVVGIWVGCGNLARRRVLPIDWFLGIGPMLCGFIPVLGPGLLLWSAWEFSVERRRSEFHRWLILHAVSAALAWVILILPWPWDLSGWWWRGPQMLVIATSGYSMERARRAIRASAAGA